MCRYEDVQMIYNYIICTSLYLHICSQRERCLLKYHAIGVNACGNALAECTIAGVYVDVAGLGITIRAVVRANIDVAVGRVHVHTDGGKGVLGGVGGSLQEIVAQLCASGRIVHTAADGGGVSAPVGHGMDNIEQVLLARSARCAVWVLVAI